MPPNFYHCKYCLQVKKTETALNRHIAHSAPCFQSWQNELVKLTSSTTGVDGTLNCPSLAIDPSMLPDARDNEVDVVYDEDCLERTDAAAAAAAGMHKVDKEKPGWN